jgi:hypothetical protein
MSTQWNVKSKRRCQCKKSDEEGKKGGRYKFVRKRPA